MTKYAVEIEHPNGNTDYMPLTARTDNGARRQAHAIFKRMDRADRLHLTFYRASDGMRGTLDL